MHDATVAIEDVHPVIVRLANIKREEFLRDGNRGIACGGNRLEQFERAAEFLVEHRARQVVATLRAAAEKEPAAHLLVRLVDRDVLAGHPRVPDEKRGGRQSAKSSTDDVRPHGLCPRTPQRRFETNHPTSSAAARCKRSCCYGTAHQRDELAAPHSITSSARASSVAGMSRPSAFAVLRLITSSYFTGACTGRSA